MTTQVFEMDFDTGKLVESKKSSLQVGQIIFLNGYGQDEHSHDRMAVYELTEDGFKTVNLDKFTFRTLHGWEVKPIERKFGIGLYYKAGDMATTAEIMAAIPKATENLRKANEESDRKRQAANEEREISQAWFRANRPEWAKAIIVAHLEEDKSDSMSDYFGSHTVKTLVLAWSATERNNFYEMKEAARNAEETAFLADSGKDMEHRDNYTGGNGYWLGKRRYSGWQISKDMLPTISTGQYPSIPLEDIRIKEVVNTMPAKNILGDQVNAPIRFKINQAKNGIELYFPGKPATSVLDDLKANGWRWSRFNSCWYSRDGATARRMVAKYLPTAVFSDQSQDAALVQAQEDATSDNFCQANNI